MKASIQKKEQVIYYQEDETNTLKRSVISLKTTKTRLKRSFHRLKMYAASKERHLLHINHLKHIRAAIHQTEHYRLSTLLRREKRMRKRLLPRVSKFPNDGDKIETFRLFGCTFRSGNRYVLPIRRKLETINEYSMTLMLSLPNTQELMGFSEQPNARYTWESSRDVLKDMGIIFFHKIWNARGEKKIAYRINDRTSFETIVRFVEEENPHATNIIQPNQAHMQDYYHMRE